MKQTDAIPKLGNPNDDSHGQCYAPVVNGKVIEKDKEHIKEGETVPPNYQMVPCDISCHSQR